MTNDTTMARRGGCAIAAVALRCIGAKVLHYASLGARACMRPGRRRGNAPRFQESVIHYRRQCSFSILRSSAAISMVRGVKKPRWNRRIGTWLSALSPRCVSFGIGAGLN
jgi:hypothetical protein